MIQTFFVGLGTAIAKNLVGWLKPALADKKIDKYEWIKGAETILVASTMYTVTYLGLDIGLDLEAAEWISSAIVWAGMELYETWRKGK